MSRREIRGYDTRRHRSRFDREPSPKRYRRDVERENEKPLRQNELDKDEDQNQKQRLSLQYPLPDEALLAGDPKSQTGVVSKESENKDGPQDQMKQTSDPTEIPRSRSYFQHDDRGGVDKSGKRFGHRTDKDYGPPRHSKEQRDGRAESYTHRKDEAAEHKKEDRVWRHDGYFELEAKPNTTVRKRPSFREQKLRTEPDRADKVGAPTARNHQHQPVEGGRGDQRWLASERSYRPERSSARGMELNRAEARTGRHGGSDSIFRGRERVTASQGYRPTGGRMEKWKHDLYDETNKSPSPKNEEDQISKIEALLAS